MNTPKERIPFEFGLASDVGRKRKGQPNQDSVELVLPEPGQTWHPPLLLVADGMGGHLGGAQASQLVVQVFRDEYRRASQPADNLALMQECLSKAHEALQQRAAEEPKLERMGSTLVAVTLESHRLQLMNVGDSRAYIIRGQGMLQISQDQSWVGEQIRAGILTEKEARVHPYRSRLTMAVTAKRTEIQPFTSTEKLEPGNIILICTDGLWGVVPESLILSALLELTPQAAAKKLIDLANRSQGPDNISVIVARRDETA